MYATFKYRPTWLHGNWYTIARTILCIFLCSYVPIHYQWKVSRGPNTLATIWCKERFSGEHFWLLQDALNSSSFIFLRQTLLHIKHKTLKILNTQQWGCQNTLTLANIAVAEAKTKATCVVGAKFQNPIVVFHWMQYIQYSRCTRWKTKLVSFLIKESFKQTICPVSNPVKKRICWIERVDCWIKSRCGFHVRHYTKPHDTTLHCTQK